MRRLSVIVLITILLVSFSNQAAFAQEGTSSDSKEYIIIYDEGHAQYFTSELMNTALTSLNTSLDTDSLDVTVKLVVHDDKFNSTNLQGSDLVIVSNPGKDNDTLVSVDANQESTALKNLVKTGGSVLFMSNPLSNDQNITGHGLPMNDLIWEDSDADNFGALVKTRGTLDEDNTTVIADPFNKKVNDTFIYAYENNFSHEVFMSELNDINATESKRILVYTAQIEEQDLVPGEYHANVSEYGYVYTSNYQIELFQQNPRWMFGKDYGGDKGRALLLGSTVMFSDYEFNNSETWIEQENNLEFFQNIVAWLLGITPIDPPIPIVTEDFSFFIQTDLFLALILSTGVFVLVFGNFIYKGRLSVSEIFNVFTKERRKKQSDSDSKKSKKQARNKRTKRERRKRT